MVSRSRGFTLIEMIMVVMIVGIAGVGISSLQSSLFAGSATVNGLQIRTALMLECAEQVLAVRRWTTDGYAAVNSTNFGAAQCGGMVLPSTGPLSAYAVPSVTITEPYTGAGCPTNGSCKLATITLNGVTPLTLMLADY